MAKIVNIHTGEEVVVEEPLVNTVPEKIVFDLEPDINVPNEQEESAEELITSILMEEETQEEPTMVLDLDDDEITENEPTLNTLESTEVNADSMKVEARERESRLRSISQQLRTPSGLTDLEDVPAYQRNNIELDQENHSSEDEKSTYTLSEGENNTTELKQNNSFLHDNVD